MFAISGQRLTISTIEKMRDNESAGMFFDYVSKMATSHTFIEEAELGRRKRKPNYAILQNVDGYESTSAAHAPATPRDDYRKVFFDVIDKFITSLKERFEQNT